MANECTQTGHGECLSSHTCETLLPIVTADKLAGELEEHLQNLEGSTCGLKKSKCQFLKPSVEYLGHRVDSTGLHPTEDKLKAVAEAPPPRNLKELRSFLGLLNYYGSFIRNLSTLLHPLNSLLQKGTKWKWSADCQKAFDSAKKSLTSSSVLVHYDPSLPIRVAADASSHGLGACSPFTCVT